MKHTYKDLMLAPLKKGLHPLDNVVGLYVIPTGKIHDSGFACMYLVAEFYETGELVRLGGGCDDLKLEGRHFNLDCTQGGVTHIWNSNKDEEGCFTVVGNASTIYLYEGMIKA